MENDQHHYLLFANLILPQQIFFARIRFRWKDQNPGKPQNILQRKINRIKVKACRGIEMEHWSKMDWIWTSLNQFSNFVCWFLIFTKTWTDCRWLFWMPYVSFFKLKPTTLLKATLLHRCFPRFLHCPNITKSHNASHLWWDFFTKKNNGLIRAWSWSVSAMYSILQWTNKLNYSRT